MPVTSTRGSGSASERSSRACQLIGQILERTPERRDQGGVIGDKICEGLGWPKRFAATCWFGSGSTERTGGALPSARRLLVPMATAGGSHRGKYRRRLPALQQIVQLLLFRTRHLAMRKMLFESLTHGPLTEPPPAPDEAALAELAKSVNRAARAQARPFAIDSRGRCRLLQWLRTGNPRAEQRILRPRTFWLALCRIPAPCRRADGHRAGDQEYATRHCYVPTTRRPIRNGSLPSAPVRWMADYSPAAMRSRAESKT